MRSIRRLAATFLVFGVVVAPPIERVATAATCTQPLTLVSAPAPGSTINYLFAVDAPRQVRAFAVGLTEPKPGGPFAGLVERWNGTAWAVQAAPNPWTGDAILYGVYAHLASDVWAVGFRDKILGAPDHPLALHWNGTVWQVVPTPSPTTGRAEFLGVSGAGGAPVFAVGWAHSSGATRTLIERWNGATWSIMHSPNVGSGANLLSSVDAVSSSDAWAVGNRLKSGTQRTLIEHWDGVSWSVVQGLNRGTGDNALNGVVALGANNAWAVGQFTKSDGSTRPLIEHWNGTAWKVVKGPALSANAYFRGVDAVSAHDIWAVGRGNGNQGFAERWNGTAWNEVAVPPGTPDSALYGVAARATGQVWAVGTQADFAEPYVVGRCT